MGDSLKKEPVTEIKKEPDHYSVKVKDEPVEETSIAQKNERTVKEENKDEDKKPDLKTKREEDLHQDKKPNCKRGRDEDDMKLDVCQMCDLAGHTADICSWKYSYCKDWKDGDKDCKGIRLIIITKDGIKRYRCQFGICTKEDLGNTDFSTPEYWIKACQTAVCYRCGEEGHRKEHCPWNKLMCRNKECCQSKRILYTSSQRASIGKQSLVCEEMQCKAIYDFQWLLIAKYEKEVAKNIAIQKYWETPYLHGFETRGSMKINFNKEKCEESLANSQVLCQICNKKGHRADQCDWVYRTCEYCDSIRFVTATRSDGSLFLSCQNPMCPKNFEWLNDAISSASYSRPYSYKCFNCGVPRHFISCCPWKGLKCRKQECNSVRVVKVSYEEATIGIRYLKCEKCGDFQWFWHANFERGVCKNQNIIDYWSTYV